MPEQLKRFKYFRTNKYQRRIIILTIIPSIIICLFMSLLIKFFHRGLINMLLFHPVTQNVDFINKWAIFIISTIWFFFAVIFVFAYNISMNMVGAFARITRELDEIIDGKDKKRIGARNKDELANELLKRINVLIRNLLVPSPLKLASTQKKIRIKT